LDIFIHAKKGLRFEYSSKFNHPFWPSFKPPSKSPLQKLGSFQFNILDQENNGFIETSEREDILNVLKTITSTLNLQDAEATINEYRKW
jgi:hypothetical protein